MPDDLRTHQRKAVLARWAKTAPEERSKAAAHASSVFWAKLTAEQRSAEMRRRAAVRKRRKPK